MLDRILRRTGHDAPDDAAAKLDAFERFLRLHIAAWSLVSLAFRVDGTIETGTPEIVWRGLATVGLLGTVGAPPRLDRYARPLAAALVCGLVATSFPSTSNHGFYGALLAVALLVLRGGPAPTTAAYLRATVLLVCFGAGLQKALHGTWWRGSFLAWEVFASARFETGIGWMLSDAALSRLFDMPGDAVGAGPYVLSFGPALVASWAVVVGEIALPVVALVDRARRVAAVAMLGLVGGFELVAHEVLFGGLFAALLSLFFPARIVRWWLGAVAALYLVRGAIFVSTGGATW
ncbi:MAG TPA: hypothetical protein RMH99_25030 [Sandaracinaceae bacterium LLY-WYZ-13_1]|nr:hypothetical protein [Sandaracinaceae bacterium LLY-WYZ-13_1]